MRHDAGMASRWIRAALVGLAGLALLGGCGDPPGAEVTTTAADGRATEGEEELGPKPTLLASRQGALIVFLHDDAPPSDIDAIRARLEEHVGPGGVTFVSKEDAHAEFSAMFQDRPEVVAGTSPADLPRSLRVKPTGSEQEQAIEAFVEDLPGVKAVVCADRGQCR
jgi:hypothetical protein